MSKEHNKSGSTSLKILNLTDECAIKLFEEEERKCIWEPSICGSGFKKSCMLTKLSGARKSYLGEKYFLAHISALIFLGREAISDVSPTKNEPNALSISHLCGRNNCFNPYHLIIELKRTNDSRENCLKILNLLMIRLDKRAFKEFKASRYFACPHDPPCGSIRE